MAKRVDQISTTISQTAAGIGGTAIGPLMRYSNDATTILRCSCSGTALLAGASVRVTLIEVGGAPPALSGTTFNSIEGVTTAGSAIRGTLLPLTQLSPGAEDYPTWEGEIPLPTHPTGLGNYFAVAVLANDALTTTTVIITIHLRRETEEVHPHGRQ